MSQHNPEQIVWLYDAFGNQKVAVHELQELRLDWALASSEVLTFVINAAEQKAQYLQSDQIVRVNDRLYRNVQMVDARVGSGVVTTVTCEALWYDLIAFIKVGNFAVLGVTPEAGITSLLENTGWNAGTITTDTSVYSMEANDASTLEHLKSWAAVTGNELRFNTATRTLDFIPDIGTVQPVSFRYGRNIRGITRRWERPRSTRLYAYGAGGLSISSASPTGLEYVENYDWYIDTLGLTITEARGLYRKDQVWVDQRYLSAVNLYDAALERSARLAQPVLSYTVDVADLSEALATSESGFTPGDYVTVEDTALGVDVTTRVVRYDRDLLSPERNSIELDFLRGGIGDATLTSDQRAIDYGASAVLVDSNTDPLTVNSGVTAFAALTITVSGTTTPIMGSTFVGVASGTGTLTVWATLDGSDIGGRIDLDFVDGDPVEISFPTFVADIDEGTYVLDWRASITTGLGTVDLPANQGRGWAIVRGAVGVGFASSPNQVVTEEVVATTSPISASSTVLVAVPTHNLSVSGTPSAHDFDAQGLEERVILPFTLDNPVFGKLDGVGELAPPLAEEWDDN